MAAEQVGILIVDQDIATQRALKNVLDSEGWRVRIVPLASHALQELATGAWNLVIVNTSLLDLSGPVFATLKELAQAQISASAEGQESKPRSIRVLFLVPSFSERDTQVVLDRENLDYAVTPYHFHDFLQKVSDLLVESGAVAMPMRTNLVEERKRRGERRSFAPRPGAMFASREDYQMTEEEIAEFERQEENDRKRREKEKNLRLHR